MSFDLQYLAITKLSIRYATKHGDMSRRFLHSLKQYKSTIELLCASPGVDRQSAITIISEISTDMYQFSNSMLYVVGLD